MDAGKAVAAFAVMTFIATGLALLCGAGATVQSGKFKVPATVPVFITFAAAFFCFTAIALYASASRTGTWGESPKPLNPDVNVPDGCKMSTQGCATLDGTLEAAWPCAVACGPILLLAGILFKYVACSVSILLSMAYGLHHRTYGTACVRLLHGVAGSRACAQ